MSYDMVFIALGQGTWPSRPLSGRRRTMLAWRALSFLFNFPTPDSCLLVRLRLTSWRSAAYVLSVGGGEEVLRLMGLPTDRQSVFLVYLISGTLVGMAGVILVGWLADRGRRLGIVAIASAGRC